MDARGMEEADVEFLPGVHVRTRSNPRSISVGLHPRFRRCAGSAKEPARGGRRVRRVGASAPSRLEVYPGMSLGILFSPDKGGDHLVVGSRQANLSGERRNGSVYHFDLRLSTGHEVE